MVNKQPTNLNNIHDFIRHRRSEIINEIANGREPLMSEAGLFNVGIILPSLSDLADLLVQLSDYEIPVNGGEQSVATSLFIEDPEGNGLEIIRTSRDTKPEVVMSNSSGFGGTNVSLIFGGYKSS